MTVVNRFRSRHLLGLLLIFVISLISHNLHIFLVIVRNVLMIFHHSKCRSIPSFFEQLP